MEHVNFRRYFACNLNEGIARSWRSLRAPDQALESEDERIHLRRTQRHLHHRSSEDAEDVQGRRPVCRRNGRTGQECALRGHQASGAGSHRRRGQPLPDVLRQPALAGRPADQHADGAEIHQAPQGTGSHGFGGRRLCRPSQEGSHPAGARAQAPGPEPGGYQGHAGPAGRALRDRFQQGSASR